jgi:hypothetical protein
MLGLEALMFKGRSHSFLYPEQAPMHPQIYGGELGIMPPLQTIADAAEVIHFVASTYVETGIDISQKKIVVQHGGTLYRQQHEKVNEFFAEVDASIIQCPDLLGLGAKNEHLIYYPVDTDWIRPVYEPAADKPVVGHFPSNPEVKGTAAIIETVEKLEGQRHELLFAVDTTKVPWQKHLTRMADCDIVIETCAPKQGERAYGEWGNTALEAAALGKVVVTNSIHADVYEREYGECALHIANTPEELERVLGTLLSMDYDMLQEAKEQSRAWAVKNHSMQATANRLWEKVYSGLLEREVALCHM